MTPEEEYLASLKTVLPVEIDGKVYDLITDLDDIIEGNPYIDEKILVELNDGVSFWYTMDTDNEFDQYFLEFAA